MGKWMKICIFAPMLITPDTSVLREWISRPRDIVILSHRNPDGDAMGSSLALQSYFAGRGHSARVCLPSEYPANFEWMPGAADILIYDVEPENCVNALEKADLVICCDFNSLDRIDKMGEVLSKREGVATFLIDHHIDPEPFADEVYSNPSASSTCEMVVEFLDMLGIDKRIERNVAEACYTGILTDTGRFRYAISSRLFEIAARLIASGVRDTMITDHIFNSNTEKQLRLLGYSLYERMEVLEDYNTAIISLSRNDYKRFAISRGDTEGIVNYMLSMPGIRLAAFITEQPTITKYSLRSKGDISVQAMAQQYFNGGGHKNASGGAVKLPLKKAVDNFKKVLPQFMGSPII